MSTPPIDVDEAEVDHLDPDAPAAPISVPDNGETSEGGKLKMIVQLLKRSLGVKDLAAMRLSLPASLLEPIPNLEYWMYLDRADLFAAINDSEDPFERMLAVIRFTFTKDLKFIRGKVCKPYNSVLGEHFRSHWDIIPVDYPSDPLQPPIQYLYITPETASTSSGSSKTNETGSVLSFKSAKSKSSNSLPSSPKRPASIAAVEKNLAAGVSNLSLSGSQASGSASGEGDAPANAPRIRVAYITEQVSHHPPISTFHAACPDRGVTLTGVDQISARVSGTAVRVAPGSFNKGIFAKIESGNGAGEQYQITHPVANVNGILRGSFYVTVCESTVITCTGGKSGEKKLRAIIEYKDEPWLGKAQFAIEGVIHTYSETSTEHEEWTKVKHVPRTCVVAQFDGSWRGRIRWKRADSPDVEYATLLDLAQLHVIPKNVRSIEKQLPTESRKLWEGVTTKLLNKEFGDATKVKQAIEQRQRDLAAERKRRGEEFIPAYFEKDIDSGIPVLTEAGRKALEEELNSEAPGCP
ncbi:hypothetical protein BD410DRAFT_749270 [Rickenella mellea]|uniref:Oxysterol-binding protein n=1 Tax=Rickenella mellea TaxID=50990 RepID=A0A4Y7Q558_9AGAM|nr:hypothetical protein BD410DRAFT_749270 [Rickenella mellea]